MLYFIKKVPRKENLTLCDIVILNYGFINFELHIYDWQ